MHTKILGPVQATPHLSLEKPLDTWPAKVRRGGHIWISEPDNAWFPRTLYPAGREQSGHLHYCCLQRSAPRHCPPLVESGSGSEPNAGTLVMCVHMFAQSEGGLKWSPDKSDDNL